VVTSACTKNMPICVLLFIVWRGSLRLANGSVERDRRECKRGKDGGNVDAGGGSGLSDDRAETLEVGPTPRP
jgi:hypothetical protein